MTDSSTMFPHKDIHKATEKLLDDRTLNQIVHVLIQTWYHSTIYNVRSHSCANCNMDHYIMIAKL